MPKAEACQEGFTLLEALVALAILSSSLMAIFSIISNNHASQMRADTRWRMALLADALLQKAGLETSLKTGHWEGARDDFAWNLDVAPYMTECDERRGSQLHAIRVRVSSQSFRDESVEVATLRLSERNR
jgi:prepilin-type N-terminal cleavage/methylation domain-containing protein